jgi:hypothetical protein
VSREHGARSIEPGAGAGSEERGAGKQSNKNREKTMGSAGADQPPAEIANRR